MRAEAARGFTLIEVLVAFTLLGLVMGALLQVFGDGLRALDGAGTLGRATLLAQSLLERVEADTGLAPGEYTGVQEEAAGEGWRWTVRIAPYQDTAKPVGVRLVGPVEVEVTVRRAQAPRARPVILNSLRLRPLAAAPGPSRSP